MHFTISIALVAALGLAQPIINDDAPLHSKAVQIDETTGMAYHLFSKDPAITPVEAHAQFQNTSTQAVVAARTAYMWSNCSYVYPVGVGGCSPNNNFDGFYDSMPPEEFKTALERLMEKAFTGETITSKSYCAMATAKQAQLCVSISSNLDALFVSKNNQENMIRFTTEQCVQDDIHFASRFAFPAGHGDWAHICISDNIHSCRNSQNFCPRSIEEYDHHTPFAALEANNAAKVPSPERSVDKTEAKAAS